MYILKIEILLPEILYKNYQFGNFMHSIASSLLFRQKNYDPIGMEICSHIVSQGLISAIYLKQKPYSLI